MLDGAEMRERVRSPTYQGGMLQHSGSGLLDPAKLCRGLAAAAADLGVRIHEHTEVSRIGDAGASVRLETPAGSLAARGVVLATSAYRGLVPAIRRRIIPVYDYVLVTEPLSESQRREIGWEGREGISDSANQFHYYRLTADDRILWGGYDAIYNYGNGLRPELEQRDESFARLSQHLFATFPQLDGIAFTHRWGGAIDTCSRSSPSTALAHGGRVAYTVGHTGLGVGASRFGARVALDLLAGLNTEATRLKPVSAAAPVPARAAALGDDRADPPRPSRCRPARGQAWVLAAAPRPARPRVRQLTGVRSFRRPKTTRSASAQAAKQSAPTAPVAVSSAPAAATTATPLEPRISTAVAAPRLGPTGSSPTAAAAINSAIESSTETSTPTPSSTSQLRTTCAPVANITRTMTRLRLRKPRRTSSPARTRLGGPHHPRHAGDHRDGDGERRQRHPPRDAQRRDQGEREHRRQRHLDHDDRQLGGHQVGALGLSAGADRRSAVIRTARPKLLLKRLPR